MANTPNAFHLPDYPRGILIDLAGVLHTGDTPLAGAQAALMQLREAGIPLRFLTNTTRTPRATIVHKLHKMGLGVGEDEVITAVHATRKYVQMHGLHPYWLVHPSIESELPAPTGMQPDAVVVGDAGPYFSSGSMNAAFRHLMRGVPLIAMARNRYFEEPDGLSIDMGAYVAALEYASGVKATITGKPSPAFFDAALADMGIDAADAIMVGDDLRDDVLGAQASGIAGVLVRSGKYRSGDEVAEEGFPALIVDDFAAAVEAILAHLDSPAAGIMQSASVNGGEVSPAFARV